MQSFEPDDSPGAVEIVEQGRAVAPLRQIPENAYGWSGAKSREKIANGVLSVWLVGAVAGAPFAWIPLMSMVANWTGGAGPQQQKLGIYLCVAILALPLLLIWFWQVSFPCPRCGERFNYRFGPWPWKFAWNGHCAHCDLRRPVMRRVEVEVEE